MEGILLVFPYKKGSLLSVKFSRERGMVLATRTRDE